MKHRGLAKGRFSINVAPRIRFEHRAPEELKKKSRSLLRRWSMSSLPIKIVGAGLAGLTLGRCLRHRNIPNILFDRASSLPRHNYGITLHPWAYQPLLNILRIDQASFRKQVGISGPSSYTGNVPSDMMSKEVDVVPGTIRCNRGKLERLLKEELVTKWNFNLKDIEMLPERIVLRSEDGGVAGSNVLIGADGVHSQVRKLSAPGIGLRILPYVVFNGKRRMAIGKYQETISKYMQGCTVIESRHGNVLLVISINEPTTTFVDVSYTYSRPARQSDPLHKPDRAISRAADIPEEFYAEIAALKDLTEPFREIFDSREIRKDGRVLRWLMRTVIGSPADIDGLTNQGVLLIGDPVHAMPILGDEGANAAIKDGVDMAEHIALHRPREIVTFPATRNDPWRRLRNRVRRV